MTPRDAALRQLLTGELPLDRMGPRLRGAARRALLSGDPARMGLVGRVIVSELLRRGDLVRMADAGAGGHQPGTCILAASGRRIDLSPLAPRAAAAPDPAEPPLPGGQPPPGIDHLVDVMEDAGKLDLQGPLSGESGAILTGILALLRRNLPQVRIFIMLHGATELPEGARSVFVADPAETAAGWLALRRPGGAAWIAHPAEMPRRIRDCDLGGSRERRHADAFPFATAAAVPLREPGAGGADDSDGPEAGLLFLVTPVGWSRQGTLHLAQRLALFVTRRWRNQRDVNRRIHTDGLTGVHNRRYFDQQFLHELERARRSGEPLTLVLADIDHFKAINDRHGHDAGDKVLQAVAQGLHDELRRIDHVCRIGGEEFALILPFTSADEAREVLARMVGRPFRVAVPRELGAGVVTVTMTYGAVTFPEAGTSAGELHRKADSMLYLAKELGRNRCCLWVADGRHQQLLPTRPPAAEA